MKRYLLILIAAILITSISSLLYNNRALGQWTPSQPSPWTPQQPSAPPQQPPIKIDQPREAKFEFTEIRFYEKGPGDYPPDDLKRYGNRFPMKTIRYIVAEVSYKYKLYLIKDSEIQVTIKWFKPDGSLDSETKGTAKPRKDWSEHIYGQPLGWAEPGKWSPGVYTVKVWMDGTFVGGAKLEVAE
jgi:hypothetical protein